MAYLGATSSNSEMDIDKFCRLIHSKLVFMTDDGIYEGVLKFISKSKQHATFEHVYELPTRDYLGTMHIMLYSILSVNVLKSAEENFEISNFDSSKKILSREFAKNERIDASEVVNISEDKHFVEFLPIHLKNNCPTDFCIIDSMDEAFNNSIKHLSESAVIGASFHGPTISRCGILTWLCLSTSDCVFLFDIQNLGKSAFREGLKDILESEKILKVVHDCREVCDCVLHLFDTKIKCIFDTQVTDYIINMQMCTGKKTFRYVNSLDSCLFKYLEVPQQFLYNLNKSKSYEDEVKFYQKRPLDKDFMRVLIKSSMYLPYLKEKQEELFMSPVEQAMDHYLNSVRSASDSTVYRMNSTEDTYSTPDCLLESVKSIRFCDVSQLTGDFASKLNVTN